MARWNPPRWSLGASSLVVLTIAGCGAGGNQSGASLHPGAEKRLLNLVSQARAYASKHDGTAVRAVLGEFVSDVRTLRSSGQLSGSMAGTLEREARSMSVQAAEQLHGAGGGQAGGAVNAGQNGSHTATAPGAAAGTTTPAAHPSAPTNPASSTTPTPAPGSTGTHATSVPPAAGQGGRACDHQWAGHHHHHGWGLGPGGFLHPDCANSGDNSGGWNGGGGD